MTTVMLSHASCLIEWLFCQEETLYMSKSQLRHFKYELNIDQSS